MSDLIANVPVSVTVSFPHADSGNVSAGSWTQVVFGIGHAGTQNIHSTAIANFTGAPAPVNSTELTALANQIAADFYAWRLASLEIRYESAVDWSPTGFEDVEWLHSDTIITAIHRSAWEPDDGLLQHAGSFGSSAGPAPAPALIGGPPGFALDGIDGDDGMPIPGNPGPRGDQGPMGAQGIPGFAIDGLDGDDGFPIQGNPGVRGDQGPQGLQGIPGIAQDGQDGEDGLPIPGPIGAASTVPGPQGIQGFGLDGADGDDGMPIPGNVGLTGPRGLQGIQGFGFDGDDGIDGMPIPGNPGPIGVQGLQGIQGFGLDGTDGDDGMPIPGNVGLTGPRGLQGIQGFGLDGADGDDGMPIPGSQGQIGPQGIQGFGLDGADGDDGVPIPGNAGLTGARGPQGVQGFGFDGSDGDDGMSIPGMTGQIGPQGVQGFGLDGTDGDDGVPIPGLQGLTGPRGLQGIQGFGFDGDDGDDGMPIPGGPGPSGAQGVQGVQGFGLDGVDGDDGMPILPNIGVNVSGGITGLTTSGGPVTGFGIITLAGILNIAHGGSGQNTAYQALDAFTVQSASIASAATTDLSNATGIYVTIIGTTTITSFGTVSAGAIRVLNFASILTVTYNASTLILPGATNITTAAGDVLIMESLGAGAWKCISYLSNVAPRGVTSVDVSAGTTGLTTSGGPITTSGVITLAGVLNPASGGTGQNSSAWTGIAYVSAGTWSALNVGAGLSISAGTLTATATGTVTSVSVTSTVNGLAFAGNPITTSGTITLSGVLAIPSGGTGQTTPLTAFNALSPMTAAGDMIWGAAAGSARTLPIGTVGQILTVSSGLLPVWAAAPTGTVSSVSVTSTVNGLAFAGNPITTSGTITLSGVLAITSGGTGQTTAGAAFNALQPMTAKGQLMFGGPFGAVAVLSAGTAGQILTMGVGTPGVPFWGSAGSGTVTSVSVTGGGTGLAFSGNPITTSGTITLGGTLAIANGGTGQATGPAALYALAGWTNTGDISYAGPFSASLRLGIGTTGQVLTVVSGQPAWVTPGGGGTVTSVNVSGGTTGLTTSGGPITSSGTITLGGVLGIGYGGTGNNTALGAFTALSPIKNQGDLIYGGAAAVPTWLPIGTAGQLLWVSSGVPAWVSVTLSGGSTGLTLTGVPTVTLGGTLANTNGGTGADSHLWTGVPAVINGVWSQMAIGSVGQVLTVISGTSAAWVTPGAGSGTVTSVAVSGGSTGLTTSGGPITSSGTITLAGILGTGHGGTGLDTSAWSSALAFVNSAHIWQPISVGSGLTIGGGVLSATGGGSGTVTSVTVSGGSTGLAFTGNPVTTSGTITLTGTLGIGSGGTGQTTKSAAFNALIPMSQNGDLIYCYVSGGIPTALPLAIGTAGQILTVVSGFAVWAECHSAAYSPSTPSNWDSPAPSTVGAALDRLAAAVKALGGSA